MSPTNPHTLRTTRYQTPSDNPSVALLHFLSRPEYHEDEPLVALTVHDLGRRSGVTLRVRDEDYPSDQAVLDLDLEDLRELHDALGEAVRIVETLLAADALVPRAA